MLKENQQEGVVLESLLNLLYKVQLNGTENIITCYLAGKMRQNKIRVMVGDEVVVVIDPYKGKATNRIVRRK